MQWRHAGEFKQGRTKLADYAFFSVPHVYDTIEGLILAKLLSKLMYSRVIAISLLGRDKFPRVYWRIFRMFTKLQRESIRHKNLLLSNI
jgi:hypothetical protein